MVNIAASMHAIRGRVSPSAVRGWEVCLQIPLECVLCTLHAWSHLANILELYIKNGKMEPFFVKTSSYSSVWYSA